MIQKTSSPHYPNGSGVPTAPPPLSVTISVSLYFPSPSFLACYRIWLQFPCRNSCNCVVSDLLVSGMCTSFGQRLRWNGFHISLRARVQQHRGQGSPGTPHWWWWDVSLVLPSQTLGPGMAGAAGKANLCWKLYMGNDTFYHFTFICIDQCRALGASGAMKQ